MQNRERPEANCIFHLMPFVFTTVRMNNNNVIQFDVIIKSLPVEILRYVKSSTEQSGISLLQPYLSLERFLDK